MRFLNIGCGNLFVDSPDWENVDQNPFDIRVKAVNLTGQLPYADSSFEVIYSSHVLEHIDREYVPFLLSECFRLIKNGGIVRIVVPDFDEMVNSYLHHLNLKEWTEASFVKDEILDQCIRKSSGGRLLHWYEAARFDENLRNFISHRNGHIFDKPNGNIESVLRPIRFDRRRILRGITRRYFILLTKLIPKHYRQNLVSFTHLGELHKWVYDFREVERLLAQAGFHEIKRMSSGESQIHRFPFTSLDLTPDGHIRKGRQSMFIEASRK